MATRDSVPISQERTLTQARELAAVSVCDLCSVKGWHREECWKHARERRGLKTSTPPPCTVLCAHDQGQGGLLACGLARCCQRKAAQRAGSQDTGVVSLKKAQLSMSIQSQMNSIPDLKRLLALMAEPTSQFLMNPRKRRGAKAF